MTDTLPEDRFLVFIAAVCTVTVVADFLVEDAILMLIKEARYYIYDMKKQSTFGYVQSSKCVGISKELTQKKLAKGKSIEEIADELEEKPEDIQNICNQIKEGKL